MNVKAMSVLTVENTLFNRNQGRKTTLFNKKSAFKTTLFKKRSRV
jgi:hypothetical protein